MASGHPFYLSYVPENIFPFDNQDSRLANNTKEIHHDPAMTPDHIGLGARAIQGPFTSAGVQVDYPGFFLQLYNQLKGFMPLANTLLYISTYQPPNRYQMSQATQKFRSPGKQKAGNSPSQGVYTGYQLESYNYYTGYDIE